MGPLSNYMTRSHKLTPLFRLTFRRASLQHPLLAGALGKPRHTGPDMHQHRACSSSRTAY